MQEHRWQSSVYIARQIFIDVPHVYRKMLSVEYVYIQCTVQCERAGYALLFFVMLVSTFCL